MTFQEIILKLNDFWSQQNCIIQQPYDVEKGAGTMNPATFLRALGPEPWRVAYVEPSRRPTDGRYGENPNRLQHYYQYQVILKPSPDDVLDVYLDSLRAIGIDPDEHDIRFVEDNWESPTLGAWGLGWEVWLDGMEVTQFTYFQQCGGIDCRPVSAEITYGLSGWPCLSRAWTASSKSPGWKVLPMAMFIIAVRWSILTIILSLQTRKCSSGSLRCTNRRP